MAQQRLHYLIPYGTEAQGEAVLNAIAKHNGEAPRALTAEFVR